MLNTQKRTDQRSCNCRNSKCMKLYCQCFSARVPCRNTCHCIDCQNLTGRDLCRQSNITNKRISREELIRTHKGCACRRSGCTKKYCQCFQSGLLCKEACKCIDCQNNESLTNRKVINQLRKRTSDNSNRENGVSLYPLYLSQNSQHLNSIIAQSNPLSLQENWLQNCARLLYQSAQTSNSGTVMDKLIQILSKLEQDITKQQDLGFQEEQFSSELPVQTAHIKIGGGGKGSKFVQSQLCENDNIDKMQDSKQWKEKDQIEDDNDEGNDIMEDEPLEKIPPENKQQIQIQQKLDSDNEIKNEQDIN